MVSVTGNPSHPDAFLSVTAILPFVVPKLTVMLDVPCPVAIVAPSGTVHVYVDPAVDVILYETPVALHAGVALPVITEVTGRALTLMVPVAVTVPHPSVNVTV
jgi:hypothetical protein